MDEYTAERIVRNLASDCNIEFIGKYKFRYYPPKIDPQFKTLYAYCFIASNGIDIPKYYTVYYYDKIVVDTYPTGIAPR